MPLKFDPPRSAYIHIPFCLSKCHYCDFNSFSGYSHLFNDYVKALEKEIRRQQPLDYSLQTIYIGGGTPTVLSADQLNEILSSLITHYSAFSNAEITVEANPGTIKFDDLQKLREGGFNRLSLGVQSLDDKYLSKIGRIHTAQQAFDAYNNARKAGFSNISIDLIYALPGQVLNHWERTLREAIGMSSEHISLYELTVEDGTQFASLCDIGQLELPDEDIQYEMYELAISRLTSAGYEQYEVSSFAKPSRRCRHNQVYWNNQSYYGFGAGATSYVDGRRARRVGSPSDYIDLITRQADLIEEGETLDDKHWLSECIILGLRMMDWLDLDRFHNLSGLDPFVEFDKEINNLMTRELIEKNDHAIRITHKGLLLLNDVQQEFAIPGV